VKPERALSGVVVRLTAQGDGTTSQLGLRLTRDYNAFKRPAAYPRQYKGKRDSFGPQRHGHSLFQVTVNQVQRQWTELRRSSAVRRSADENQSVSKVAG